MLVFCLAEVVKLASKIAGHRNMYYLYAIVNKDKKYIYVGISDNYTRRIEQHNNGYNKTTKPYRPFEILLIEKFDNRIEARKREKYLKSGCGKELLKSLIK